MELRNWMDLGGLSCWRLGGRLSDSGSTWQAKIEGEVWLWLNAGGEGVIWGAEDRMFLKSGMYSIFGDDAGERWRWTRLPGVHEAEVVVISRAWLARRIGAASGWVHPEFRDWLENGGRLSFAGLMTGPEKRLAEGLAGLDADQPGAALQVEARVLEWAALRLFRRNRADEGAGFCRRISESGSVERALLLLRERLTEPIDLNELGRRCGVSPTHLSRKVKAMTGSTLREHQRRLRIAAACELLRENEARVTEVALEVGYQSLSHFAKAFREETGVSPSGWKGRRDG